MCIMVANRRSARAWRAGAVDTLLSYPGGGRGGGGVCTLLVLRRQKVGCGSPRVR